MDTIRSLERQLVSELAQPSLIQRDNLALEWLAGPAALAAPTVLLESITRLRNKGDYLVNAFAASAAGDSASVRRILEQVHQSRLQAPPAEWAIDALYPEAVLLTWLGDDRGAIAWLDPTLTSLPNAAPGTFAIPSRPGALVHAMALRAELAAGIGDVAGARRWANAVTILWEDADGFLQPLVSRMRQLAN